MINRLRGNAKCEFVLLYIPEAAGGAAFKDTVFLSLRASGSMGGISFRDEYPGSGPQSLDFSEMGDFIAHFAFPEPFSGHPARFIPPL